jgi:hypothetical protein
MIHVRRSSRPASLAGAFVAILVATDLLSIGAQQGVEGFSHWAVAHALPLDTVEAASSAADSRR